jgi:ATP-dependent RNA helicase RhlE
MNRGALTLGDATFFVLDEADLMLDMGFLPDLRKVAKMLPQKRQTMLFSATMSKNMNEVAGSYLKKPVRVEVARAGKTADKLTQELHYITKHDKAEALLDLLGNHREDRTLVFGRTKFGMEKLSKRLITAGFKAGSIHGNKTQPQRDRAIAAFKSGEIKVLVATDVAARGLDIPDVKYVYNYELPNVPEAYVHRIGRTARAGKEGSAISFCSMEEMDDLLEIQKVTGVKIPVTSGIPWKKHETKLEKDKMKESKLKQQKENQQRRTKSRDDGKPKQKRRY